MATVGQMIVRIGANIRNLQKGMGDAQNSMKQTAAVAQQVSNNVQNSSRGWEYMYNEMSRIREVKKIHNQAARAVMGDYFALAKNAKSYGGDLDGLMGKITALGNKQKKMTDEMLANSEHLKAGVFQSIGQVMARSTQSSKLAGNIDQFGGPLRQVDAAFLQVSNRMEEMAKRGNAAYIALQRLGPTANMKQLNDQIKLINAGIMRMNMVALVTGFGFLMMNKGILTLSNSIDGRLIKSGQQFSAVWTQALTPFIHAWTTVVDKIVNAGTAIGQFFANLAQNQPVLSAMIMGFGYLLPAIVLLLAPMAILGDLSLGLKVAFAQTWMIIGPFVTGLASILGTAILVAGGIVILAGTLYELWKNSETLRNVIVGVFQIIKQMWDTAMAPIGPALGMLGLAFTNMIQTITGQGQFGVGFWQTFGDTIAGTIANVAGTLLPYLGQAFQVASVVIVAIIQGLIIAFNWISAWWAVEGPTIIGWAQQVGAIIADAFRLVVTVAQAVWPTVSQIIQTAMQVIMFLMQYAWPIIAALISGVWDNIKGIIHGALQVIQNVIQLFTNLLQGNWSAAWQNVKNIVVGALEVLWNYIQLWGLGRVLGFFRGIGGQFVSVMGGAFSKMGSAIMGKIDDIAGWIFSKFNGIKNFFYSVANDFFSAGGNLMAMLGSGIESAIGKVTGPIRNVTQWISDHLPHSPAKIGPLSTLDRLDFAGPMVKSMYRGQPQVQRAMSNLFSTPVFTPEVYAAQTPGRLGGGDIHIDQMNVRDDSDIEKVAQRLYQLQQGKLRGRGVYA